MGKLIAFTRFLHTKKCESKTQDFLISKKKSGGGRKAKHYEAVNSDSENDHYNDDFDPNNPFGDDEIEKFHNNRDKVMIYKLLTDQNSIELRTLNELFLIL